MLFESLCTVCISMFPPLMWMKWNKIPCTSQSCCLLLCRTIKLSDLWSDLPYPARRLDDCWNCIYYDSLIVRKLEIRIIISSLFKIILRWLQQSIFFFHKMFCDRIWIRFPTAISISWKHGHLTVFFFLMMKLFSIPYFPLQVKFISPGACGRNW